MDKRKLILIARQAVRDAQQWIDDIGEHGPKEFGEMDQAYEAYHEAAESFFELYDEIASEEKSQS